MTKKELIAQCRYYKGTRCSAKKQNNDNLFCEYEQKWVELSLEEHSELLERYLREYMMAGLYDFNTSDGVPQTLKALLLNRYEHWNQTYEGFEKWYLYEYLNKKDDFIAHCRYYKGEENNPFEGINQDKAMFWFYEKCWVKIMIEDDIFLNKNEEEWLTIAKRLGDDDPRKIDPSRPFSLVALLFNRWGKGKHSICYKGVTNDFAAFYRKYYLEEMNTTKKKQTNMKSYPKDIREEELKNRVRTDFFSKYDPDAIIGNVDFAVGRKQDAVQLELYEKEYYLWAECKRGTHQNIYHSLVQLIITIGKARTFDRHLPPNFLGAFDAEKMAFIPYEEVSGVFYQNDFNWNVTPSDHETKEFQQVLAMVQSILDKQMLLYYYDKDEAELRKFIAKNFITGTGKVSKVHITKTNFITIYQRWAEEVKPTIAVDWEIAKKKNILSADFYLADILSQENQTLKDKLRVLLQGNRYEMDGRFDEMGLWQSASVAFKDKQVAHTQFWNRYHRPPKEDYWDYIVERRDLLVPQDVRERKGSYFTPQKWVALSQEYLAAELGEDWQDEYYIWDCCAGTGNLLNGLSNKYNIWASTLDQADVDVMNERIANGANLLESHVFLFDFLNDDFSKLPQGLQDIINDEEKRKKLVVYINPPYAEAASATTATGTGANKKDVAVTTAIYKKYLPIIGIAGRELFAQFFIRIYQEIPSCVLAEFSKLKILQAPNFSDFRLKFRAKLGRLFLVPSGTFDNVKGKFPIGFFVWNTAIKETFQQVTADVYDDSGKFLRHKLIELSDDTHSINDWIITTRNRPNEKKIGYMSAKGNDFQNTNFVFIINEKEQLPHPRGSWVTDKNIIEIAIYYAARHCIEATWLNDRDQFLFPNDGWQADKEFQADCLAFTLFNNNIQAQYGVNHWIPFREQEVEAKEKFASNFMANFIAGKIQKPAEQTADTLFADDSSAGILDGTEAIVWSAEAQAVMDAGRELWKYYHAQFGTTPQGNNPLPAYGANAAFYDIRLYFQGTKTTASGKVQMNTKSDDAHYTELITALRTKLRILADKIAEKVYAYGFLK